MTLTYITGGIRSGKSEFAEQLAATNGGTVLYVAFGMEIDTEMKKRINTHKERRPIEWGTLEETNQLVKYQSVYQAYDVILVDCISSWLANKCMEVPEKELKEECSKADIINEVKEWLNKIQADQRQMIVVSNEVGLGGIAISPLGRFFQDILGIVNKMIAQEADFAYAVFSGIPLRLK